MSRPCAPFCVRGHEIAEVGRYANGNCRACNVASVRSSRANRGRRMKDTLERTSISAGPLVEFLARREFTTTDPDYWYALAIVRGRRTRISLGRADELCVRMGYHPAEIFGSLWWEAG